MPAITASRVVESVGAGALSPIMYAGPRIKKATVVKVVGGTGYATGGVDVSPYLETIGEVLVGFCNVRNGARIASFDPATKKVLIFTALGTEAVNATDQTAAGTIDVLVIGR